MPRCPADAFLPSCVRGGRILQPLPMPVCPATASAMVQSPPPCPRSEGGCPRLAAKPCRSSDDLPSLASREEKRENDRCLGPNLKTTLTGSPGTVRACNEGRAPCAPVHLEHNEGAGEGSPPMFTSLQKSTPDGRGWTGNSLHTARLRWQCGTRRHYPNEKKMGPSV